MRLRLRLNKIHFVLELNQSQWLQPYVEFNTKKKNGSSKKDNKDGKALYTLMNNPVYGKTMKNLKNRINLKLAINYLNVSNKEYLK